MIEFISGDYRDEKVYLDPTLKRSLRKIPKLILKAEERILHGFPYQTEEGIFVYKAQGYSNIQSILGDQRLVGAETDSHPSDSSFDETISDFSATSSHANSCNSSIDDVVQQCSRCRSNFKISENGNTSCFYQPQKAATGVDRAHHYQCCYQLSYIRDGCTTAIQHVFNQLHPGINGSLKGYKSTKHVTPYLPTLIGMDCEMVYTDLGFEAARATLVICSGNIIFDKFIRPKGKIYDYNTKFSGIKESDMDAAIEFEDAQDQILALVSGKDTLVGHSLESDLVALKIIHRRILDTSLLFDISRNLISGGSLLRRQKLKSLVKTYLNYDIQADTTNGHCSYEDAKATLNLVFHYLRNFTFKYYYLFTHPF